MKTIRMEEKTYEMLSEIRREMENKTGESKSDDEIIEALIHLWKKRRDIPTKTTTRARATISKSRQTPPGTIDPGLFKNYRK